MDLMIGAYEATIIQLKRSVLKGTQLPVVIAKLSLKRAPMILTS